MSILIKLPTKEHPSSQFIQCVGQNCISVCEDAFFSLDRQFIFDL